MVLGKPDTCMWKNPKRSIPITCTKLNSKYVKDLNIKLDSENLSEEKVGKSLKLIEEQTI